MHQPHYLPWLGYMEKLDRADLFIFVDHIQFERKGWQNRNFVKTPHGQARLTVPVVQRSRTERIIDKQIDNSRPWRKKHRRTVKHGYHRAPHFEQYWPKLDGIYKTDQTGFAELSIDCCARTADALGIDTPWVRSSDLGDIAGAKSHMIVSLCHLVGADAFLSGDGSRTRYLDERVFHQAGIEVVWQQFKHPVYEQQHPELGFVSNLAAVDLLFNIGPAALDVLRASHD